MGGQKTIGHLIPSISWTIRCDPDLFYDEIVTEPWKSKPSSAWASEIDDMVIQLHPKYCN